MASSEPVPAPAPAPAPVHNLFTTRSADSIHPEPLQNLTLQIRHNLQYQHHWTNLETYTHSPLTNAPLPRPLLLGLPPTRLYTHPDEQIELLKNAAKQRRADGNTEGTLEVKAEPEREWILPARLSERWTLRRLAEVFAGIGVLPPGEKENEWRTAKRVVLATVDQDSTVVYYIVHDGVVKPRQN